MATASQSVTEELLKLFLNNDPGLGLHFNVELEAHDGEVLNVPQHPDRAIDRQLRLKTGRDYRILGDEFNNRCTKKYGNSLHAEVKEFFDNYVKKAKGDPEEFWPKFKGIIDNCLHDNYLDDKTKVLAAVLCSVKGLYYIGNCVTDFTMRYITENNLECRF